MASSDMRYQLLHTLPGLVFWLLLPFFVMEDAGLFALRRVFFLCCALCWHPLFNGERALILHASWRTSFSFLLLLLLAFLVSFWEARRFVRTSQRNEAYVVKRRFYERPGRSARNLQLGGFF